MRMLHGLALIGLLLTSVAGAAAGNSNARLLSRLQAAAVGKAEPCQPWRVPEEQQCAYIKANAAICYPEGGFQEYLVLHYCVFGQRWFWLSLLLLLATAVLAFAVLLTVSERFFCPALELISDYLKLTPVVAGATLLSFGNGAPDTFTQVAAVGQEGGSVVGMALSEPLGGGMFASNVVFGLVVLIASKQHAVIQRLSFLKDVYFYLVSLLVITFMLADGKVTRSEAGILLGLYVVYVAATFYFSRADEPLHADLALREFPPEDGGIDIHDSSSEDLNFESDIWHPGYVDATTSIRDFDLEAPPSELTHLSRQSSVLTESEDPEPDPSGYMFGVGSGVGLTPAVRSRGSGSTAGSAGPQGSRTLQALLSYRHRGSSSSGGGVLGGLREPLLVSIDERQSNHRTRADSAAGGSVDSSSGNRDSSSGTRDIMLSKGSLSFGESFLGGVEQEGTAAAAAAAAAQGLEGACIQGVTGTSSSAAAVALELLQQGHAQQQQQQQQQQPGNTSKPQQQPAVVRVQPSLSGPDPFPFMTGPLPAADAACGPDGASPTGPRPLTGPHASPRSLIGPDSGAASGPLSGPHGPSWGPGPSGPDGGSPPAPRGRSFAFGRRGPDGGSPPGPRPVATAGPQVSPRSRSLSRSSRSSVDAGGGGGVTAARLSLPGGAIGSSNSSSGVQRQVSLQRGASDRGTGTAASGPLGTAMGGDWRDGSGSVQGWSPRAASDSGAGLCYSCGSGTGSGVPSPRRTYGRSYTMPHPGRSGSTAAAAAAAGVGDPGSERGLLLLLPPSPRLRQYGSAGTAAAVEGSSPHADLSSGGSATAAPLSPHLQQLQQQHFAEQVELLEQQAAEHDALLAAHEEGAEEVKAGHMSFKHRLQYPFVQLLSCTMPRVGTGSGHRYLRWRACLLPITVPLLWFAGDPSLLLQVGWLGLVFGAGCAAVGSCIIWASYPASAVPRKTLKGVFAVLAFMQAIVWLNISASALVQVCVVVGVIFGLEPALLGATVLAWGNSVPDLINNMAMAKDGFPSMAVAACFASPLFTLLVGMGGALIYGTFLQGGPLPIPIDGPLMIMAGFAVANMVQHLVAVPLLHNYSMRPSLAAITFTFYACFNVVYVLATVGVIDVSFLLPGRK